jgi:hypothetical protein
LVADTGGSRTAPSCAAEQNWTEGVAIDTVADTVASGLTSCRVPAERIRPYVPVSGAAPGVALGATEEVGDGEAVAAGDLDELGDPPPQESTSRAVDRRIAPRRITHEL